MQLLPHVFVNMLEVLQLQDIWRRCHSNLKDYTFFLARHAMFSRIDMIFTTSKSSNTILEVEIGRRLYSDPAGVSAI